MSSLCLTTGGRQPPQGGKDRDSKGGVEGKGGGGAERGENIVGEEE